MPRTTLKYHEALKRLFSLWITANNNREVTKHSQRIERDEGLLKYLEKRQQKKIDYKSIILYEYKQQSVIQSNSTPSLFIDFKLNLNETGIKVNVVISPDGFLIIKMEDSIFLAIGEYSLCLPKTNDEEEKEISFFKITGLDCSNSNLQEGFKTEYLVKLIEKLGISIKTTSPDPVKAKTYRLRADLIKPLERANILEQTKPNNKNHYYEFTFVLKEGLDEIENINNNLNYYMTILTGDPVIQIEYDLIKTPSSLENQDGYIERPNIESECYEKITTGDYIRIKGSKSMGKTCLLDQIIKYAETQEYLTIKLDFNEPEKDVFNNLKSFYTWFCNKIIRRLDIQQCDSFIAYVDYNKDPSINANTTYYFEDYILHNRDNQPKIVLAIDNVDRLFTFSNIVNDVCGLWRSWYDEHNGIIRNSMIMIITHSTMEYPNFNIESSPLFGIGHTVNLSDWQPSQVKSITQQYNLDLSAGDIEQLMSLIGGHPYLVRKAIEYLHKTSTNVAMLLEIATNEDSPFSSYLDQVLQHLEILPELCIIYKEIIQGSLSILDRDSKFYLDSMGLIKITDNQILPKYPLYQNYFLLHFNYLIKEKNVSYE